MSHYITMSLLSTTEGFASQMGNFAALYAIAQRSGHRIIFMDSWTSGKGLMLTVPFDNLPLEMLEEATMTPQEQRFTVLELDTRVAVDSRVWELEPSLNYDIRGLFSSYRYWYGLRDEVFAMFRFKREIVEQAAALIAGVPAESRELVSVHVRRNDYLISQIHLNLPYDYYASAFSLFKGDQYDFLVFSDDIEWCRQAFGRRKNFHYATQASPYVDMCAMTMCHHHIIANSSFSMWGALLNPSTSKRVMCPSKFLKDESLFGHINHVWFPDHWTAVDYVMT